jgi:MoaA/NifB/PqqE/SkfB family radical SAM enzyme
MNICYYETSIFHVISNQNEENKVVYEKLPLNVLLTKKCNADCRFCVEKTKEKTKNRLTWSDFAEAINTGIEHDAVSDVLLLGGEPLYFCGILELIKVLKIAPIITTNAHRLVSDRTFFDEFCNANIKALNISLPHYDEKKRSKIMGSLLFSNEEIKKVLRRLSFDVRINTLLVKDYINTLSEIEKMAEFCAEIGASELKVGELTARNPSIHDFIRDEVTIFNRDHYVEIPVPEFRDECHKNGGTLFWKKIAGVSVYFNSPPEKALSGGKDESGKYYHRVLFNDGYWGYSWRRDDGLFLFPNG